MEELTESISKRTIVGLLSDTDPIHWNYIKATWPWIGKIQNPTLSYEVGVMKPDANIFQAAAKNVKTRPEHCLFIDDLQANVKGAQAIGMHAIRFESPGHLEKQLQSILKIQR